MHKDLDSILDAWRTEQAKHPSWSLLNPWNTSSPPHEGVLDDVARETVAAWVKRWWADTYQLVLSSPVGLVPMTPAHIIANDALRNSMSTLQRHVHHELRLQYPLPYNGRSICLVLQQWAHDDPDRRLAQAMRMADGWNDMVDHFCGTTRFVLRLDGTLGHVAAEMPRSRPLMRDTAESLRRLRLPVSPACIRFLISEVFARMGQHEVPHEAWELTGIAPCQVVLPARGIVVNTLVFARLVPTDGGASWVVDADPELSVIADLEHASRALWGDVARVADQHRAWVRRMAANPLGWHPDPRGRPKGSRTKPDPNLLERLEHACEELERQRDRPPTKVEVAEALGYAASSFDQELKRQGFSGWLHWKRTYRASS